MTLDGLPAAVLWEAGSEPDGGKLDVDVAPDRLREIKVFVSQPHAAIHEEATPFSFVLTDRESSEQTSEATEFLAPEQTRNAQEGTK